VVTLPNIPLQASDDANDRYDAYDVLVDEAYDDEGAALRRRVVLVGALALCVLLAVGASVATGLVVASLQSKPAATSSSAGTLDAARAAGYAAGQKAGYTAGVHAAANRSARALKARWYARGLKAGNATGYRNGLLAGYQKGYGQATQDTQARYQQGVQTLQKQLAQSQKALAAVHPPKPKK